MADRLAEAQRAGRVPHAPGYVAFGVVVGGLVGAGLGVAATDWGALATACWGSGATPSGARSAVGGVLGRGIGASAAGALAGLALAQLTLGAWAPRLRARWRPASARPLGRARAVAAGAVAAVATPWALAPLTGGDPGRVLLWAAPVGLALAAAGALPFVLAERAAARRAWRDRVTPDPPPKRDDDAPSPEAIAALRRAGVGGPDPDLVLLGGARSVGLTLAPDRAPRVVLHGAASHAAQAAARGVPVVVDVALVDALAATPSGDVAPSPTWPALRAAAIAVRSPS